MSVEEVLRITGQVAGIGGLAFGLFLSIGRAVLKVLPTPKAFRGVSFFRTIDRIILYTFILAVIGVTCYAFLEMNRRVSDLAPLKDKYESLSESHASLLQDYEELKRKYGLTQDASLRARSAAFEVLLADVTFDLTHWAPVPPEVQETEKRSYEVTRTKRVLWRADSDLKTFASTYGTASQLDPEFSCKTHLMRAIENTDSIQTGKETLRRWILEYDVSGQPLFTPFTVVTEITGWNALQNQATEHEGTLILFPTRRATLKVIFPPSKLPKPDSFECFQYPLQKNHSKLPFENPKLTVAPDRSWVQWEIEQPSLGYHYEIHWKW
jgi:hypothetical protein